jgi:Ankyrin repeats (many copies)
VSITVDLLIGFYMRKIDSELFSAITNSDLEKAASLIEEGADVNARDNIGYTLLMYAISSNSWDLAKLLIENGADVNALNPYGVTPLMQAISGKSWDLAKLLIENGADVNACDNRGKTPLFQAIQEVNLCITLDNALENGDDDAEKMINSYKRFIKTLLLGGVRLQDINDQGQTSLKIADPASQARLDSAPALIQEYIRDILNYIQQVRAFHGFSSSGEAQAWLRLSPGEKVWIAQGSVYAAKNIVSEIGSDPTHPASLDKAKDDAAVTFTLPQEMRDHILENLKSGLVTDVIKATFFSATSPHSNRVQAHEQSLRMR